MKKSLSLILATVFIAVFSSFNESPYLVLHIDKSDPPPVIIFLPNRIVPLNSIAGTLQIDKLNARFIFNVSDPIS